MLTGKSAIVTGSTSGIGLAIAQSFAAEGCNVMLNGFGDAAEIEQVRSRMQAESSGKIAYNGADMSKPPQIDGLIEDTQGQFGGVDILVNNAGIQFTARVENFPPERWETIIAINLSAAFYGTRAALPLMQKRGWGRIINIASVHGLVASTEKAAYVAAKHGIIGLTKVVALENAESGITCNAICPGWVLTPLVEKQIEARAAAQKIALADATSEILKEKQPSMKFTAPEEIGGLAVFLCSPAAANMTGVSLPIDGGWTAQ